MNNLWACVYGSIPKKNKNHKVHTIVPTISCGYIMLVY